MECPRDDPWEFLGITYYRVGKSHIFTIFWQDEILLAEVSPAHEHVLQLLAAALVHFQKEDVLLGRAHLLLGIQLSVPNLYNILAPAQYPI